MAKRNQPQANNEQKVQTKYDRKMEQRRKQEEKEKREAKIMRIGAIVVCIAIVVAVAASIITPILNKKAATTEAYVTIGDHEITKVEYDYFFHASVNNYISMYSSFLGYMGLDTTKDLDTQKYSDQLTWKDFFDQMAVEQIKQTKAIVDDAAANNFTYDSTEEYESVVNGIKTDAEAAGVSVNDYYKTIYGEYATEKNMEPYIKEGLFAAAYYKDLTQKNTPNEQEIKEYYAEHVQDYDKVDYRSFIVTTDIAEDASEDDSNKAMEEAKSKADAMMEARKGGEDFKALCLENATEENKATYEDAEKDASLTEGAYYVGTPGAIAEWLYEEGRAEGDITVIEDTVSKQYYVVEFVNRYYDEADDENISNTISSKRTEEYVDKLMESYQIVDNKGQLKYLTVETTEETNAENTDAASETENEETTEETVETAE